jgi:hypothetical protein
MQHPYANARKTQGSGRERVNESTSSKYNHKSHRSFASHVRVVHYLFICIRVCQ